MRDSFISVRRVGRCQAGARERERESRRQHSRSPLAVCRRPAVFKLIEHLQKALLRYLRATMRGRRAERYDVDVAAGF